MATTLVSIALEELFNIMEEHVKRVMGVDEDIKKLKSNLQAIHGVLAEAERRQFESPTIKQWLDNLKDVSYSIDDVLDEWRTEIRKVQVQEDDDHSWLERQLLQLQIMIQQVCSSLPISCFSCTELSHREKFAREIKKLNQRLDEIAKERKRYNFDLNKGYEDVRPVVVNSAIDVAEVKGRDQDKKAIIKMLMGYDQTSKSSNLEVVSIAGIGGLGKTTLAKLVYNDNQVEMHFENRIWVYVSKPFDEIKVAKAILEILTDAGSFLVEYEAIMHQIEKLLKGKRFLLVLDDVWEDGPRKWEQMRNSFLSASLGSCILVTTRDINVSDNMGCTRDHLYRLGKLSFEACWSIFSEITFFDKDDEERARFEPIGREIVKKCDGLALAAKTLGCNLRFKNSWKEWQSVLDSEVWEIEGVWSGSGESKTGFSSFWLSYYDLVSDLRPCFSYCAILPKDYEIKRDDLIQLWMAQGYLRPSPGEDMERIGEKYIQHLAACSFFEDLKENSTGNAVSCKMHSIVHDFAQYIRKNECFSLEVNDGEDLEAKIPDKGLRHLRIMLAKEVSIPSSFSMLKKLRTLWVQSKGSSQVESALPKLFIGLTCLRSLNLSNCDIVEIPSSIKELIHIRQIDLSHNKELKELPEALCELYNLQTLNVNWCTGLVNLPSGIKKLINLRHLRNGGFKGVLPKGVRRLQSLRSLDRFSIGQESEEQCSLKDMKNLNHLQGNLSIRGLENVADVREAKIAELEKKTGVSQLQLWFGKGEAEAQRRKHQDAELLNGLEPSPYVEELRIYDYKGSSVFPSWLISLTNLKTLLLTNCKTCEQVPPLGKLPCLEYLRIWGMDGVKNVGKEVLGIGTDDQTKESSIVAFPRLIKLRFVRMRNWEKWADKFSGSGVGNKRITMPRLRSLSFAWCPKLKEVPQQILSKETLQELIITCSPILSQRYKKIKGKDWPTVSHIPKIKVWDFGEKLFMTLLEERGLIDHL